jgi:hypothetical protein
MLNKLEVSEFQRLLEMDQYFWQILTELSNNITCLSSF